MKMEDYINTLTEQIRYKKAREGVKAEITGHILDQTEAYEQNGMEHDAAIEKAVQEMGDPVAAGVALDRIHRPQFDWQMLAMAVLFSVAGLFLMFVIKDTAVTENMFAHQCFYTVLSFGVIMVVYFMDYSLIGQHGISLYLVMTVLFFLYALNGPRVNGRIPGFSFLAYLYVPVFVGVLYQMRGQRIGGVIMAVLLLLFTCAVVVIFANNIVVGANIGLILFALLIFAIAKGWFQVYKKAVITVLIICCVSAFVLCIISLSLFYSTSFRYMRMMAFLNPQAYNDVGENYYVRIRESLPHAKLMGNSTEHTLPEWCLRENQNFIFLQIVFSYGLLAGIVIVAAIACFGLRSYKIVKAQKNQLGWMVSVSCLLIMICVCAEGILMNFGWFPITSIQVPFISYGGSATLTYAVLIGLLMSCHRYENIVTDTMIKRKPGWHLKVSLERR